ncbi:structural protein VP5 [Sulfolobus polyhedral virus 1]|uniref:Structural protein VP5 n=2 Tax=Alphaportoglobovirus TaxID=2169647 RepID=A0A1W6I185_SPV1|nr:structural protein VP5 [Sulfolobus polyhedral virus 1]YP_010084293.1 putative viral structural protein [Sulfolobus polyhedral virus 2]ARM37824.1 structural protein VP5 [Sulfolobus polyhedral virus 1]AZI76042.1 putative viral structural protein [Sulfolobus polyhedral virus 2]
MGWCDSNQTVTIAGITIPQGAYQSLLEMYQFASSGLTSGFWSALATVGLLSNPVTSTLLYYAFYNSYNASQQVLNYLQQYEQQYNNAKQVDPNAQLNVNITVKYYNPLNGIKNIPIINEIWYTVEDGLNYYINESYSYMLQNSQDIQECLPQGWTFNGITITQPQAGEWDVTFQFTESGSPDFPLWLIAVAIVSVAIIVVALGYFYVLPNAELQYQNNLTKFANTVANNTSNIFTSCVQSGGSTSTCSQLASNYLNLLGQEGTASSISPITQLSSLFEYALIGLVVIVVAYFAGKALSGKKGGS